MNYILQNNHYLLKVEELDFFMMSLDEPNRERHWADLRSKVPWAQHVTGVIGFDAVHRRCAELAKTPYFITVDADNIVHDSFLSLEVRVPTNRAIGICWGSVNAVNGLTYGNGGIKLWEREYARNMAFHELGTGMDFCWDTNFDSIPQVHSTTYINGSPEQAFRAGYREGVKLSTVFGRRVKAVDAPNMIEPYVQRLLKQWCSVGLDVHNGGWAVLGARTGLIDNLRGNVSNENVSDFGFIRKRFESVDDLDVALACSVHEMPHYTPYNIPVFTAEQSRFLKEVYTW
jgi:hypothetical protein